METRVLASAAGKSRKAELRLVSAHGNTLDSRPLQRSQGEVRISFKPVGRRTGLDKLYPARAASRCACLNGQPPIRKAVLINTAGGLTGGDAVKINVDWHAETSAIVTTQACERIYKSTGTDACITSRLTVAERATAHWLPQETILFQGARLGRRNARDHGKISHADCL